MSAGEVLLCCFLLTAAPTDAEQINPVPREVRSEALHQWTFDSGTEGWVAERNCTLSARDGSLVIEATGDDPYLHCPVDVPGGHAALEMRARSTGSGSAAVYWTTDKSPGRGEDKARHFSFRHDGKWHEVAVPINAEGQLADLRIDPGAAAGRFEIDWLRLVRREPHPLVIERVDVDAGQVRFTAANHGEKPLTFTAWGETRTLAGGGTVELARPIRREAPLEPVSIELVAEGLPPVRRTVFLHHPDVETNWTTGPLGEWTLKVALDGSVARISRDGQLVAVLAPLVHLGGTVPKLEPTEKTNGSVHLRGEGIEVVLSPGGPAGDELNVSIQSDRPCEGPVVRAVGPLEQGLFAGLEYLGRGERSSSTLDVETEEHLRFAPDPLKVTLPLMAFVTSRGSVAMTWDDMSLEPTFATPNFFDAADDHRMSLRGEKIHATIRFGRDPLEESIAWAVTKAGLPPLPEPPRSDRKQQDLCLAAIDGPLHTADGWGHCVEDRWPRHPYADIASTLWRLTGEVPELPRLVPGGSHLDNESLYFVTGRVAEWKEMHRRRVEGILGRQQPDGSFRYHGEYARGHFEDTASGVCARPAAELLEYARWTGDRAALEGGLRALEFMKRFRTPRGAQVWEVPLHTPDQLASAYLVWAYVRGYELTGDRTYLRHARKWALSGVPFVYLWDRYPMMRYATPPVFGATNWRAPCWIGLPVQWVGIVYAYALTMIAPYDDTLDWNHLARGILITGQQMQFPDGPYAGLLPDSVVLRTGERRPWRINPCSLVSLRRVLDGQLDALAVAKAGDHRVVSPFPVTLRDNNAHVEARPGVRYQLLIDGQRIVDVTSKGSDTIPLEHHP